MKLPSIILCLLLAACTPLPPAPVPPPEPPAPVVVGQYIIREFNQDGNLTRTYYDVISFRETRFPRSVTFDHNGQLVTLDGSYQISRSSK